MLKLGIIEAGESDYSSLLILVEAPGKYTRPCVGYCRLNGIIRTEKIPLPNIEETVEKMSSAKLKTVLDLAKCYWQIPCARKHRDMLLFVQSSVHFVVYECVSH